jgi:hypothetical protein
MEPWLASLEAFLARIWEELARLPERGRDAPLPVLATIGPDGPEARALVLRGAFPGEGLVELHTDTLSSKMAELRRDPRAALHLWDPELQLQTRLRGRMSFFPSSLIAWHELPKASRGNYGTVPPPATPIDGPEAYTRRPDPERMTVLSLKVEAIDAVHLGREPHRRALFERRDGWRGRWLAP